MLTEAIKNAATGNLIDRIVNYVNPVRGRERLKARIALAMAGSYTGASYSKRALKQWNTAASDADSDILYDLDALRQRSRDLVRNAPIATGAINVTVSNVVGSGLKLQSRLDRAVLPLSEEQADAWEANTEREFRLWAESQDSDAARTLRFYDHQDLAFRQVLENGDVIYLTPRYKRSGNPYSLSLMAIEADRLINENWKSDTETLIAGVEKDRQSGAPLYYHICNGNPYEKYARSATSWQKIPAFGSNTGLRNVLHLYRMLRPGQTRGVPFLAPVIEPIKQLSTYTDAELMAAVVSGMFTVFIKTESGGLDFDISGMGAETGASATDTDVKLGNGAVVGLAKGESVELADPKRPNAAFDPFVQAILQQIGTALEIPYEVLIRSFSASYSASRASLLEAWRFFKGRRSWLSANFCQPIYEIWLYEAVAIGRIPAPGFFRDPIIRKAYCGAKWIGDAPGYIDPSKDIDSAVKRIENFLSTLDEETALLGGDFDQNLPRILKEQKILRDNKLKLSPADKAAAKQPNGGQNDEAA